MLILDLAKKGPPLGVLCMMIAYERALYCEPLRDHPIRLFDEKLTYS